MKIACKDCPKYQRCNANICPLDTEWPKRKHLAGESVCFYLLEAQKIDAEAIFSTTQRGYLYTAMVEATQAIKCRYGHIKTRLERASKTASRIAKPVKQEVTA